MSGFSKEETIGRDLVKDFISDDFKQAVTQVLSEACQGRNTANFSFQFIAKDGKSFSMLLNAGARNDVAGNIIGVIAVGHNLTQYNVARGMDVTRAEELAGMIDQANAPILGVNARGIITIWNKKAAALSGYTKQDTFGKNLVDNFIIDSYKERVQAVISSAILGTNTSNYEVPLVTKDGRHLDLVLNAAPRRDLCGEIVGVVCIGQDVTFLRRATKEFGLYLWHIDDIEANVSSMSQDAQKSIQVIAELFYGQCHGESARVEDTWNYLKGFLHEAEEFDVIEMFEVESSTQWFRLVGQRCESGVKGYLLDVTQEHAAQLKSKQAEHYLRIISQATFDFVLSVDSKYLVISAEWGGSEDSDRPQNGDHLTDWLYIEDDLSCREMISQAMLVGSSSREVMFRRGESMTQAHCLCVIEPDDPGNMIMAVQIQVTHLPDTPIKKTPTGLLRAALERRDAQAQKGQRRCRTLASVSEDLEVTSPRPLSPRSEGGLVLRGLSGNYKASSCSSDEGQRHFGKSSKSSDPGRNPSSAASESEYLADWRQFRQWRMDAMSNLPTLDSRHSQQSAVSSAVSAD